LCEKEQNFVVVGVGIQNTLYRVGQN